MYNSLQVADRKAPELGLGETVRALEQRYETVLADNAKFTELTHDKFVPEKLFGQGA